MATQGGRGKPYIAKYSLRNTPWGVAIKEVLNAKNSID